MQGIIIKIKNSKNSKTKISTRLRCKTINQQKFVLLKNMHFVLKILIVSKDLLKFNRERKIKKLAAAAMRKMLLISTGF